MSDFDPYYVWLGIPPKNQPPDHYRLLGIEKFESDPRVIESAADRQMSHVKTFQAGKNGAVSQRVLNHLSQARNCLLNESQKEAYDQSLRQQFPATPPSVPLPPGAAEPPMAIPLPPHAMPFPPPALPHALPSQAVGYPQAQGPFPVAIPAPNLLDAPRATFPAPSPSVSTIKPAIHRPQKAGLSPAVLIVGVVAVVAVFSGLVVALWNMSTPTRDAEVTKVPTPQQTTTSTNDSGNSLADPPSPPPSDVSTTAARVETNTTPPEENPVPPTQTSAAANDTHSEAPANVSPSPSLPSHFAEPPSEPAHPLGPPIAVLKLIQGQPMQGGGVGSGGQWEMVKGKLRGVNGGTLLPITMPSDYQLDIQIDHIAGDAHMVVGFPVVGRAAAVLLNWHTDGTTVSGIHDLNGVEANKNITTYKGRLFTGSDPSHVRFVVRGNFIQVLVDGKAIIQWRGDPSRLSLNPFWRYPGRNSLCLSLNGGDALISSIEVTPLEPLPAPPRPAPLFVLNPARRLEAPTPKESLQARTAARKLFAKELAGAKTRATKRDLAGVFLTRAREEKDELPVRLGLLQEAQHLAANNLDAVRACQAIDQQAKFYDIDVLLARTKTLEDAAKECDPNTSNVELRNVVGAICVTLDEAVAAERFDLAQRLGASLKRLSQHKKFGERVEYANKRLAQLAWANELFDAATASSSADTLEAKEALGRYACFVQGNWNKGLPLLADGSGSGLTSIAQLELGVRDDIAPDEEKYRKLGDAWWELSGSAQSLWKDEYRRQARYWYEQVPHRLSAPEFQERISEAPGIADNRYSPGLVAAYYSGDQYGLLRLTRIDKNIARSWQTGNPDSSIASDNFTVVWTGTIRAPIPGKYYLSVNSDDGSRLDLDGKTLWDDFGGGAGVRGVEVQLTGEPQQMVLYYHDGIVHANCTLRWRFSDETEDLIVEEQFLRHDPLFAQKYRATDVVGNYRDTVYVPSAPEGGLLAILEDQSELPASLPEDYGAAEMERDDRYSGEASLHIGGRQRFGNDAMGIRAKIREKPGPGEYRYARFAWKKVGGGVIALQFHSTSPTGERDWRRYHTGPNKHEFPFWGGASIGLAEEAPTEWKVETRDLFADHGEFDLTGLALTVLDRGFGLFDHIYLARTMEDFDKLGHPVGGP